MRNLKKMLCVLPLIAVIGGCTSNLIDARKGSEQVLLMDASYVANCQTKGQTTVSVLAEIGFFNRSVESVEANLLQLARNGAIDMGGDTIVKGISPEYGKRAFSIYKCSP